MQARLLASPPTVVRVQWRSEAPTTGWVSFGADGEARFVTAPSAAPTTEHDHLLLGLPPGARVAFEVHDDAGFSATGSITTGSYPASWPAWTPTGARTTDEFLVVGTFGNRDAVVVFDAEGRPVWWREVPGGVVRAVPTPGGTGLLVGPGLTGEALWRLDWTGARVERVATPGFTHDFVLGPDGEVAYLARVDHEANAGTCQTDAIVELGSPEPLWDTWSIFDDAPATCAARDDGTWTHANALDRLDGRYYVGLRNLSAIYAVSAASGATEGLYTGADPIADAFLAQHQFEVLDDGLLVFDNGTGERSSSRVVEYAVPGDGAMTARWSYTPDPPLYAFVLGDVHRLENGNTLVAWGSSGRLQELRPDGATAWQLDAELGTAFGYVARMPSFYAEE